MTIPRAPRWGAPRQTIKAAWLARLPILLSLAFLALALAACQGNPQTSVTPIAGAGLVAQPAEIDLGRVPFDQQANARFTLINQGTSEIHLDRNIQVQTLEGC